MAAKISPAEPIATRGSGGKVTVGVGGGGSVATGATRGSVATYTTDTATEGTGGNIAASAYVDKGGGGGKTPIPTTKVMSGLTSVLALAPAPLDGTGGASAMLAARGSDMGAPNIKPDETAGGRQSASGRNEKAAGGPPADDINI